MQSTGPSSYLTYARTTGRGFAAEAGHTKSLTCCLPTRSSPSATCKEGSASASPELPISSTARRRGHGPGGRNRDRLRHRWLGNEILAVLDPKSGA